MSRTVTPRPGEALLLDRLLASHGARPGSHAIWVILAAFGALGIAWELPSPDHALAGPWAAGLALAVVVGSARWSVRLVLPLAGLAVSLGAMVFAIGWALGGWPLVGIATAALAVGRIGGGPDVWTSGPIWLAARLTPGIRGGSSPSPPRPS